MASADAEKFLQAPAAAGAMGQVSWADMAQDMDDEGADELVAIDKAGNRVLTSYFRDSNGKHMKCERTVKVTRKVLKIPTDVKSRQATWRGFGWDSLDLSLPEYAKFSNTPVPMDEQLSAPRNFGLLAHTNHADDFSELVPVTESVGFKKQLADIQKYFDLLADQNPRNLLAFLKKEEAGAAAPPPSTETAVPERYGRGDTDDRTVRVTNVPEYTTELELTKLFSRVGNVSRCYLSKHKETNISKGYAFVTYDLKKDAETAIQKLHKIGFQNVLLNVEWARRRPPLPEGTSAHR